MQVVHLDTTIPRVTEGLLEPDETSCNTADLHSATEYSYCPGRHQMATLPSVYDAPDED
jgi:hypothetical protein